MKKLLVIFLTIGMLFCLNTSAMANTVTLNMDGFSDNPIFTFQFKFLTDGGYGFPQVSDGTPFGNDLDIQESSVLAGWTVSTSLYIDGSNEYATGVFGINDYPTYEPGFLKDDGTIITMVSANTDFGISLTMGPVDAALFDVNDDMMAGWTIEETWVGDDQIVTIHGPGVPVPSALIMLASGIFGLVAIRRK